MLLPDHIVAIRTGIASGKFSNEAAVSQGIVLRLLNALGWPTYDISVVCPEYSLSGRRVDYALCGPIGRPLVFIEVKQIGKGAGSEQQLFEYAFHEGVQFAVLTDGQEWNFFLPAEQGNYGERRVYKLDLVERDVTEAADRLTRYLQYADTIAGKSLAAAREDYQNASRLRQMEAALPRAWEKLVLEEEQQLIELVAGCVEDLCGFRPEPDMVASFLKNKLSTPPVQPLRPFTPTNTPHVVVQPNPRRVQQETGRIGYEYKGNFYPCRNGLEMLSSVLLKLIESDPSFFQRFAGLPKHGRSRRFLAASPQDLYPPERPDLARDYSKEIAPGWWLGTNVSKQQISKIIEMACGVAGVQFGSVLTISLGN